MSKSEAGEIWVKARCSQLLKDRVAAYVRKVEGTGDSLSESDVVRKAVVEYLDRQEASSAKARRVARQKKVQEILKAESESAKSKPEGQ